MLKNIIPRKWKEEISFHIEFTGEDGSGFSFPCDSKGNAILENDAARTNYEFARNHPELFTEHFDELVRRVNQYLEPGRGTCSCGNEVILVDEYQGACQCSKCGSWYNVFGQSLIDPQYWEE